MRKLLMALVAGFILAVLLIYLFLPARQKLEIAMPAHTNLTNAFNTFMKDKAWEYALGNEYQKDDKTYKNSTLSLTPLLVPPGNVLVEIEKSGEEYESKITLFQVSLDSLQLLWELPLESGGWPWQRVELLSRKNLLEEKLRPILFNLIGYMQNPELAYGAKIQPELIQDTILVTRTISSAIRPDVNAIYQALAQIKNYANAHGADSSGYPMMLSIEENGIWKTQVALPVNKTVPDNAVYSLKKMIPGNCLVANVYGGRYTLDSLMRGMHHFTRENGFIMPAIPFESMVTNRLMQPDTSKWQTRIVFPVL